MLRKNYNHHLWIIQSQFFIKIFKELMDAKIVTHLYAVQKYMSILLIAAAHKGEFIIQAADQEPFVLGTKTLFCKIP